MNIWDEWSQEGGNVANNDTGNVACNSYEKYEEDAQLLADMGVSRFTPILTEIDVLNYFDRNRSIL